jgi:hypothetical protein
MPPLLFLLQSASPSSWSGILLPLVIVVLVIVVFVLALGARRSAGPPQTFQLLDQEEVLADLRRGTLQKLTSDIFLKKTVVLTNKRLVLVNNRLGSFSKQYIFLKDVQGLSSQRFLNLLGIDPSRRLRRHVDSPVSGCFRRLAQAGRGPTSSSGSLGRNMRDSCTVCQGKPCSDIDNDRQYLFQSGERIRYRSRRQVR